MLGHLIIDFKHIVRIQVFHHIPILFIDLVDKMHQNKFVRFVIIKNSQPHENRVIILKSPVMLKSTIGVRMHDVNKSFVSKDNIKVFIECTNEFIFGFIWLC